MSNYVQETYTAAHDAATGVAFPFTASAVLVTSTLPVGASLTVNGVAVTIGAQPTGTLIPIRCTMATFASGDLLALA